MGLFFFWIVRGRGAPGLDGSKPFASFKVKVYSWALFILVPFSLPLHVVFALISFAGSRESIYYVFAGRGGSWL